LRTEHNCLLKIHPLKSFAAKKYANFMQIKKTTRQSGVKSLILKLPKLGEIRTIF
jgi:hypothetical protein